MNPAAAFTFATGIIVGVLLAALAWRHAMPGIIRRIRHDQFRDLYLRYRADLEPTEPAHRFNSRPTL